MAIKGQFFSLDAFLALSLFVIAMVLLFSFFTVKAPLTQQYYYVDDINNLFSNVKINEIATKSDFTSKYNYPKSSEDYDNKRTINEVIRNMQVYGKTAEAETFVSSLITGLIPTKYGFSLDMEKTLIYSTPGQDSSNANIIVSRERSLRGT